MWDCGSFGTNDFGLDICTHLYYKPADFVICNAVVNILFQLWKNELIKGDWILCGGVLYPSIMSYSPGDTFCQQGFFLLLCLQLQIIVLQKILYLYPRTAWGSAFIFVAQIFCILKIKSTEKRCNEQDFSALSSIFLFTFIFCAIPCTTHWGKCLIFHKLDFTENIFSVCSTEIY